MDRFSRNFEEGVRNQADLTKQNIGMISNKDDINTADDSAAAKSYRRVTMANGVC